MSERTGSSLEHFTLHTDTAQSLHISQIIETQHGRTKNWNAKTCCTMSLCCGRLAAPSERSAARRRALRGQTLGGRALGFDPSARPSACLPSARVHCCDTTRPRPVQLNSPESSSKHTLVQTVVGSLPNPIQ